MARQLHINSRNYKEPFLLIKVVEKLKSGLVISKSYHSKIVYGSIIKTDISDISSLSRDDKERFSIKILNNDWDITTRDLIYRNEKVYQIVSINKDVFNKQEQQIICQFLEDISDNEDLKFYVDLANQDADVERVLNKKFVHQKQFEKEIEKLQTKLPDSEGDKLVNVVDGVVTYVNLPEIVSDTEREKWNKIDEKVNQTDFAAFQTETGDKLDTKQVKLSEKQLLNSNLDHDLYDTKSNVETIKEDFKTKIASNKDAIKNVIDAELPKKANVSSIDLINESLTLIENGLNLKANAADVFSKRDTSDLIDTKIAAMPAPPLYDDAAIRNSLLLKLSKSEWNSNRHIFKLPNVNTLQISRTRRHVDTLLYDISLNHFDTREKVVWWLQCLKQMPEPVKNAWATKLSDLFDLVRVGNQSYTTFWKIILFETTRDEISSNVTPFLGGHGPSASNSSEPRSNQIMTETWKFHNKNAVKLALLYLLRIHPWELTEDNIYWVGSLKEIA